MVNEKSWKIMSSTNIIRKAEKNFHVNNSRVLESNTRVTSIQGCLPQKQLNINKISELCDIFILPYFYFLLDDRLEDQLPGSYWYIRTGRQLLLYPVLNDPALSGLSENLWTVPFPVLVFICSKLQILWSLRLLPRDCWQYHQGN